MTQLLFPGLANTNDESVFSIAPDAGLLRGLALGVAEQLLRDIHRLCTTAPFRQMTTPGGRLMSVAMTNCGTLGWYTDAKGYRYTPQDPASKRQWPPLPASFLELAKLAARRAGYASFAPNSCLVNRYEPGTRLTLHQDKNEGDFSQPIVSVSLGLPATFLFGGLERRARTRKIPLQHGDVVVWGGQSRLAFHGVVPLAPGTHELTGAVRYNLTFRSVSSSDTPVVATGIQQSEPALW